MNNALGSNQYKTRRKRWLHRQPFGMKNGTYLMVGTLLLTLPVIYWACASHEIVHLINPVVMAEEKTATPSAGIIPTVTPTPTIPQIEEIDVWIGKYVDQFATNDHERSYWRYEMQCMAHFESTHHYNKKPGDDGIAFGLFQYHMATWVEFRQRMIKAGLITEVGSPFNDEQATMTTAWAISTGHIGDWGTYHTYCDK